MAITASLDLRVVLDVLLSKVTHALDVDASAILLLNPKTLNLEYEAVNGFLSKTFRSVVMRIGEGLSGRIAFDRHSIHLTSLSEYTHNPDYALLIKEEGFIFYYGVPLIAKGQIIGVLEAFNRASLVITEEWINFLETMASQAAIAIDNAKLFDDLQRSNIDLALAYDTTLDGWSRALDLRDKETEGHTRRVAELTLQMVQATGIGDKQLIHIRRGALLHDIGKMGVPDSILLKPGKLTDEEWKVMRMHPKYAFDLLNPIAYLRPSLDIPYCHHEKWDGSGYPRGLKGESIPFAARIFAIVDVWDALINNRPYRPAWLPHKAFEYIIDQSGKHFDPRFVDIFSHIIKME
jgi:HD-GYP domain-containing protein (c-di-GMP phosphodiesterase class II)